MTLPVYDKKLWLSDGMFEAPSLRSVTATICGFGAAGKTVMGAASAITNTALRITAQTAWSMGSSYIANVGAGFVNALDYNNGEVTFNWDKAVESMYSANTVAGALGAGISTSLSLSVDNKLRTTANGAEINKIYAGAITGQNIAGCI